MFWRARARRCAATVAASLKASSLHYGFAGTPQAPSLEGVPSPRRPARAAIAFYMEAGDSAAGWVVVLHKHGVGNRQLDAYSLLRLGHARAANTENSLASRE